MEVTQRNSASVGLLFFAIVGVSLMLQITPSSASAKSESYSEGFTCDPSTEQFVGWNVTNTNTDGGKSCYQCPSDIEIMCSSGGKPVSTIECNWWDIDPKSRTTVCIGCCGQPYSTPPPEQIERCQDGDSDLSFQTPATYPWDCGKCKKGCKDKCAITNSTVSREMCVYAGPPDHYNCDCCCRTTPPPPPPPSPPPPPPSPPPPPILPPCEAEDLYVAFQLPSTSECDLCLRDCKTKCSKLGSSVASECCITKSSAMFCKCCCTDNPPPPPPTSSPPPPPLSPPTSPPPPPSEKTCDAGDIDVVLKLMGSDRGCHHCDDYCPDACSSRGRYLTTEFCVIEPTVDLCHCCCRSHKAMHANSS